MTVSDEVRLARAYLCTVAEPPAPALAALVAQLGPTQAAARVLAGDVPGRVAKETAARREQLRPEEALCAAERVGARLLVPGDDDWPDIPFLSFGMSGQAHLAEPLGLWVRGELPLARVTDRSAAIVGARAATGYGRHVATSFGYGLAELGCAVFSGAAFGIDAAAHQGALAASGATVAVLACGVDQVYPAGHHQLLTRIARDGLVVSEYPPGTPPARHRFLVRNRVIAGLATGTVVVEAGRRSGARRTASDALLLGRPVMAVPGPVTSAQSEGCHRLLRELGTTVVTTAEEVLEEVGRIGDDLAAEHEVAPRPTDGLSSIVLRVHDALPLKGHREVPELSVDSGLPAELVRSALTRLETVGLAVQAGRGWCLGNNIGRDIAQGLRGGS